MTEQLVNEAYALHMRIVALYMENCLGRYDDAAQRALRRYYRRQGQLPKSKYKGRKRMPTQDDHPRALPYRYRGRA